MSDIEVRLASIHVYPVKSCAGVSLTSSLLVETGLEFDRTWMLVDTHGEFVTQRELPRMALVQPTLRHLDMVLRAPGMLALHLQLDSVEQPLRVRVWDDEVDAYDMGALPAQWFSDFLGERLRLVRFDPANRRLSERRWAGTVEAENAFSDGYPLNLLSEASLAELNQRLAARGAPPAEVRRFRPNLVLAGLEAQDEDRLEEIVFTTPEGPVRLRPVKPCPRCAVPNIDPATGEAGAQPGDALGAYRANPRLDGAVSFGMNAVMVEGLDCELRVGMTGNARFAFG